MPGSIRTSAPGNTCSGMSRSAKLRLHFHDQPTDVVAAIRSVVAQLMRRRHDGADAVIDSNPRHRQRLGKR